MLWSKSWIFSWAMSHICANDEYRSQVGATNRPENIVIGLVQEPGTNFVNHFFSITLVSFRRRL
jgi:hypothetical protein